MKELVSKSENENKQKDRVHADQLKQQIFKKHNDLYEKNNKEKNEEKKNLEKQRMEQERV